MAFKLKDGSGVEHTYDQKKLKIPGTTGDGMVVFTQGEVQEEKTVLLNSNLSDTTVLPDAGFASIKQIKCQVRVNGGISVQPITITENKTTTAPDGYAYSPVTVNVPPTSGYQLKSAIATYGAAMQNEDFVNIVYQAVLGTVEPPSNWNWQMFPLSIGLSVNSKAVWCWCSTFPDENTGTALFPGVFSTDGKTGYMEFKFSADSDDTLHFQITRLELDGENIISQVTDASFVAVATLFAGDSDSNS